MVYILLLLMVVKYIAVAWSSTWSFNKVICTRQLDITVTLAFFVLAATVYEYLLQYPDYPCLQPLILLTSVVILEFIVLKGHILIWAMSFRYFYGNEKHSKDRDIRLLHLLHPIIVLWYVVICGTVAVLI